MTKAYSINALLNMQKSLKQRVTQLTSLRDECAVKETFYEPKLFNIDNEIKASNSITKVEVDIDFDTLMEGLKCHLGENLTN